MPNYEYIESRECYGEFQAESFDRMVERRREVWFGENGSGAIRSQRIRSIFFTDDQRQKWQASPHRGRRDSLTPTLDLFPAGQFFGPRRQLAKFLVDPDAIAARLDRSRSLSLHGIQQLIGEALVPEALRKTLFDVATSLPGARLDADAHDELGRPGLCVSAERRDCQEELVFDRDTLELLGYRSVLLDPDSGYAPAGATVGWSAYLSRQLVDEIPADSPPGD